MVVPTKKRYNAVKIYGGDSPLFDGRYSFGGGSDTSESFDSDAVTLFAAMSGQPTYERKVIYNNLIVGLKDDGVWTLLDGLWIIAAHDAQAASLNAIAPAANAITLTGTPTFLADRGYTTNGTSNFLDLNFNPATAGGSYTQNSASFGSWILTNAAVTASSAGWFDGTDGITLGPRGSANVVTYRINQATATTIGTSTDSTGLLVGNRSGANANEGYKNGAAVTATANPNQASTALNSHNVQLGATTAASFAARQFAASMIGGSLNATQQLALYNRLLTYMQAVGAV